ncbi:MAG: methyltransferase [Actinomycetota bacterium]|nr:methyltransferase [Actinomycetota bacterium]
MSDRSEKYIYDPSWEGERKRLQSLERLNDPTTIAHFEAVGVAPGWTCLEVGAGAGSIARWLCNRVGPEGQVVATDLDTRFLEDIDSPHLELRRHDILEDEFESGDFDLVHARFVLEHLSRYRDALARMIEALAPGGWIVVEDVDFAAPIMADPGERPGFPEESIAAAAELTSLLLQLSKARGIQADLGRRLPALLAMAGLEDVGAEGRTDFVWSGTEEAEIGRLSVGHVTKVAVESGLMSAEERARYMSLFTEPGVGSFSPLRFGAWGRKPKALSIGD